MNNTTEYDQKLADLRSVCYKADKKRAHFTGGVEDRAE